MKEGSSVVEKWSLFRTCVGAGYIKRLLIPGFPDIKNCAPIINRFSQWQQRFDITYKSDVNNTSSGKLLRLRKMLRLEIKHLKLNCIESCQH